MKMQFTEEQLRGAIAEACEVWANEVLRNRLVGSSMPIRNPYEFAGDFVKHVSSTWRDTVECPVIKVNCYSCSRLRSIPICCTNGVSTNYCSKGHINEETDWRIRTKWCKDYKPSARAAIDAVVKYQQENG